MTREEDKQRFIERMRGVPFDGERLLSLLYEVSELDNSARCCVACHTTNVRAALDEYHKLWEVTAAAE